MQHWSLEPQALHQSIPLKKLNHAHPARNSEIHPARSNSEFHLARNSEIHPMVVQSRRTSDFLGQLPQKVQEQASDFIKRP